MCWEYRTAGHLVFSTPWPAIELKKVLLVSQNIWAQRKPNAVLEIYKAFEDRLTFLNRHMIVWFSWIFSICETYWKGRTAGHLVFWKPWPVTGHRATAILYWRFFSSKRDHWNGLDIVKMLLLTSLTRCRPANKYESKRMFSPLLKMRFRKPEFLLTVMVHWDQN